MAPDRQRLVTVSDASVVFDGRRVVDHVDLTIDAGEIVTLIGPNGAGKSTLAKLVLGIRAPDEGHVERRRGLTVGYLPQRLAVEPTLPFTVRRFANLTRRAAPEAVAAALDEVGVGHLADANLAGLSGGEMQRVLLARALLRVPDLLVLDEPTQGVDFAGEAALYDLIRAIRDRRGCGVLTISHDLHLVMAATDRVVCIQGHVCCQGLPDAVSRSPAYLELFGRRAPHGLAPYAHHHDHEHAISGSVVASCDGAADQRAP